MAAMGGKQTRGKVVFNVLARRPFIRLAAVVGSLLLVIVLSLELLRRSGPDYVPADTMRYPQIISGVWVTGFEESSFFPGDVTIPKPNDPRRYLLQLMPSNEQFDKIHDQIPAQGYFAFRITFVGRRTRYPIVINCDGSRSYWFVPDWILRTRYLGPMPDSDLIIPKPGPYKPLKHSGAGGVIRQLEDEALARCAGKPLGPRRSR